MSSSEEEWQPQVLVLGSEGMKGLLELGALAYFQEGGVYDFKNIKKIIGCSVGAIIGLLIIAGYSAIDIIPEVMEVSILQEMNSIDLSKIGGNYGLFSNRQLKDRITAMLRGKYGFVPTLKQLYQFTGVTFCAVAYNLSQKETVYLTHENEPDLPSLDAVLLSSNVPLIFHQMSYRGYKYVDGALGNPYPIDVYDDGQTNILGIYVNSDNEDSNGENFWWYFNTIIQCSMGEIRKKNIRHASSKCRHLQLDSSVTDAVGISCTDEKKKQMVEEGYEAAKQFVKGYSPSFVFPEDEDIPIIPNTTDKSDDEVMETTEEDGGRYIYVNIASDEISGSWELVPPEGHVLREQYENSFLSGKSTSESRGDSILRV